MYSTPSYRVVSWTSSEWAYLFFVDQQQWAWLFRRSLLSSTRHDSLILQNVVMREVLETILGGLSRSSSRGGVNLRSASLHAPSAFLASVSHSQGVVEKMLGHALILSPHTSSCVAALSTAASRPDWQTLEDIDVPLHQHSLSLAIDEASHQGLLSSAPSTRSHALALSSALPHAGDWLNGIPSAALGLHLQDREFRCCLQYWLGVPLHSSPTPVQNVSVAGILYLMAVLQRIQYK